MNRFSNPLKVNGIILLLMLLFSLLNPDIGLKGLPFVLGIVMLLLAPVNLVIGMVRNRNKKADGSAFIIVAGLLLLIGFSTCSAGFYFDDINFH